MTKKEYFFYLLSQLLSIIGFLALGFYFYSSRSTGHLEASILTAILYAIIFGTLGLILPCIIFFNKIGGLFYLFKSVGLGFLGLLAGLIFYVTINLITFGSIPIYVSNVLLPGILCISGLLFGSHFGIKKPNKNAL
jgi:hypothetical protein